MRLHQVLDSREVIVLPKQVFERRVERAAMAAEVKHPAVVAAAKHQNFWAASDCPRRADRHQIGFGTGIRKAHQLDRWEAGADSRGKARLERIVRAEIEPLIESGIDRAADHRMRMAKDAGGELAEEIEVFVPVEVPQPRALAAHDRQRERIDMD